MIIIKRHELQKKALAAAIFAKGGRHFLGATGPSVSAGGGVANVGCISFVAWILRNIVGL